MSADNLNAHSPEMYGVFCYWLLAEHDIEALQKSRRFEKKTKICGFS